MSGGAGKEEDEEEAKLTVEPLETSVDGEGPIHKRKKKKKKKKKKFKLPKPNIQITPSDGVSFMENCCKKGILYLLVLIIGLVLGWHFGKEFIGGDESTHPLRDPPNPGNILGTTRRPTSRPTRARIETTTTSAYTPVHPRVVQEFTAPPPETTRGPTEPDALPSQYPTPRTTEEITTTEEGDSSEAAQTGDYSAIIKAIDARMKEMCDYFPYDDDCLILKRSVNPILLPDKDGMNVMTKMLVRKILNKEEVVKYVATGTSHTAAHDGLFGYNYVWVVQRMIESTFELAGLNFTAYPRGIGSVGKRPRQEYCFDAIYGDADIVSNDAFFGQMNDCDRERFYQYNLRQDIQAIYMQVDLCGPCGLNNAWEGVYYGKKTYEIDADFAAEFPGTIMDWIFPRITDTVLTPGEGSHKAEMAENFLDDDFMVDQFKKLSQMENVKEKEREKYAEWASMDKIKEVYRYWDIYIHHDDEIKKKLKEGRWDNMRNESEPSKYDERYSPIFFDSGNVAKSVDWHPFYIARAFYTRAGTHHPGAISHLYHGNQIGYYFLQRLKDALLKIQESDDLDKLRKKASKRLPIPDFFEPEKCSLPGDMGIQCYMATQPREESHAIESIITDGEYAMKTHISAPKTALDKHYEIMFDSKDENDFLIFNVEVGKHLRKNHKSNEVWLCWFDNVFHPDNSRVWIDGKEVDFSDMDDQKNYTPKDFYDANKAHQYAITDRRPMVMYENLKNKKGAIWLISVVSLGTHEIKIHGSTLMRELFFL